MIGEAFDFDIVRRQARKAGDAARPLPPWASLGIEIAPERDGVKNRAGEKCDGTCPGCEAPSMTRLLVEAAW